MSVVSRIIRSAKFGIAGMGGIGGVAVGQAIYLRYTYDPGGVVEPVGAADGISGQRRKGEPFNVLFVGDSVALGVGAEYAAPIQSAFAERLSQLRNGPVRWQTIGAAGLDTRELRAMLVERCRGKAFDGAIVLCGVNDGKKLFEGRLPCVFRRDLSSLCAEVRHLVPEGYISIPRIPGYMRAPQLQLWPMCHFIRLVFEPYDNQKLLVAAAEGMDSPTPSLDELPSEHDRHLWASDGMHPSAEGYHVIGEWLATIAFERLGTPRENCQDQK